MGKKEQKIISEVEKCSDDMVDLAMRLTAEASTLGNEASVLHVMEKALAALAFHPVKVPINPEDLKKHPGFAPVPWDYEGRYNVVAKRAADGEGGKSALFNGHLDVVSPEPSGLWERDPFQPVSEGGYIYGRGAGDMKSGIAAMTYALWCVENAGFGLTADVTLETVIEEECTGNGALACIAAGYNADGVLIPEPFNRSILTGQVGVLWFKVIMSGVPIHVQDAASGVNAVEKCFVLMQALRRLETEMNQEIHPAYREIKHPLNLNIGVIKGGDWPSTVPAAAEFHSRLSFFPGTDFSTVRQMIVDTIEKAAADDPWLADNPPVVEFYGFRSEGHLVEEDLPLFQTLDACHKSLTGRDARRGVSTATTDVRAFHHFGKTQATCYGPYAENIHAANERVRIDSIVETAKTYALFLARWCGLAE